MQEPSPQKNFRQHLPDLSSERFTRAKKQNYYEYADFFQEYKAPPWLWNLVQTWKALGKEPFKGLTSDGMNRLNLHTL